MNLHPLQVQVEHALQNKGMTLNEFAMQLSMTEATLQQLLANPEQILLSPVWQHIQAALNITKVPVVFRLLVKKHREIHGWTYDEFAQKNNVNLTYIHRIVNGSRKQPNYSIVQTMLRTMNVKEQDVALQFE